MSDAEIGQMRNGLGLSGNQLERYQTQRSIVIKKQADLVNCSALGSLAIEKGFETTVDKLLKELLKKAAGAVGGVLGGATAISGGIVIGMLLSTEEVGESKEELDELEREQEKKKEQENGSGNNSGGNKKDKKGDSETVTNNQGKEIDITPSKNHTTSNKNPGYKGEPNSSLDILDKDGNIVTRRWFDENGHAIRDVDMTNHGNPKQHPEWPHEHFWEYGPDGKPISR